MEVARALGAIVDDVVFIGGAVAPLLHVDPVLPRTRATADVDAVIASTSYSNHPRIEDRLRARGFTQPIATMTHAHRWVAPGGIPFDLVPTGDHLGGTGAKWDVVATQTSVETQLTPEIRIRHVSAVAFLGLKWAAHTDRGSANPFDSHDLEDIFALVATRPAIVTEARQASPEVRGLIADVFRSLTDSHEFEDLLGAHLNNAYAFSATSNAVTERMRALSQL